MYTTTDTARPGGIRNAFRRAEAWLDARGKWAWITAMVLGFIFVWPVGLALLAYMIWGKQMFSRSCTSRRSHDRDWANRGTRAQGTGNHAFDSYKAEALRRLEEEQDAFEAFLQRLRNSKDKTEFDAFMDERARSASITEGTPAPAETKPDASARPGEY